MLESVISWLTPAALFVLLNLVIGTIAFTSSRSSSSAAAAGGPHHTSSRLSRSPSVVLDRLKSFNLYSSYRPSDPSATETVQTVEIPKMEQCEPEAPQHEPELHIGRSQSDTRPAAGEMPRKLAKKLKKSATLKSAFNHFDFHEVGPEQESTSPPRRPATMREREREEEEVVEVDARADDFINRFRQQLKLQRLDSIMRYKEMINRGN